MTGTRPAAGFTNVDATPADSRASLIGLLEQMGALPAIQRIRQLGQAAMGIDDGARLLDAGCGLGEETRELARLAGPKGEVTGIDISEALASEKGRALKPTGRLLRGQFVRAGLTLVTAEPVTIPVTDRHTARLLHPVFNPDALRQMLKAPASLVDAWTDVLEEAFAGDQFLYALTIWVVAGTKPL